MLGMEQIDLPSVKLALTGDQVVATHKKTKAKLVFPIRQLEAWLIRKFRDDLTPFQKGK